MPRGSHVGERTALLPSLSIQADEVAHAQPAAEPDEAAADDAAARSGLAAMARERLLSVAPERTRRRAPHFVAAVGMAEAETAERDEERS